MKQSDNQFNISSQAGPAPESFGVPFPGVEHIQNIKGFIETREDVPTTKPYNFFTQIVIVTSGGSSRAYIYDTRGLAWKYTTLT